MFPHEVLDAPDLSVQELANKISEEEVESLRFTGGNIGSDYDDGIVVTDRVLIRRFLEALRHANGREAYVGNRICYLFIQLREEAKPPDPTLTLRFYPANAADCFGPDFRAALQKLSDYYAEQVGRQISEVAEKVTEVEIANHIEYITHVTDPDELDALVQALTHLDGKAFAFTEAPNDSLWMRLHLGKAEARDINLIVARTGLADPPSLSPLLWQYYLQAVNWRNG